MRLSNENRITRPLTENLERLRITLDYDLKSWADLLRLTESEYVLFLKGKKPLDIMRLAELSRQTHLSLDAFVEGKIDFKAVAAQYQGFSTYIPEQYTISALSKRRTSITVLDYLEKYFGWQTRQAVLRKTQVQESSFSDPEKTINLRFLNDTLKFLSSNGFTHDSIAAIGMHSAVTNSTSPFTKILRSLPRLRDIPDYTINSLVPKYFDRNHHYRILSLDDTSCVFEVTPVKELRSNLSFNEIASRELCAYRKGVASSFFAHAGLPFGKTTELACVHDGAPACKYIIDFSEAAAAFATPPASNLRYFQ